VPFPRRDLARIREGVVSDQDQPGSSRRLDPDATRAVDPDATRAVDPDATRAVDPDATRAVDPDATRAVGTDAPGGDLDRTQRIDPAAGAGRTAGREPWEGTADPYDTPGQTGYLDPDGEPLDGPAEEQVVAAEPEGRRGRDLAFGVGGLVLGFLIAVIVIALGTSDRTAGGEPADSERIQELEAGLAERDAAIGELEAQVAEAQAAAGATDADAEAQRQALDERAQALDARVDAIDERSTALDQREAQLDQRQSELDQREADLAERERQTEQPADGGETDGDEDGEGLLPDLDTEEVETIIDRLLDRIRELF
jgi:hypothetical protein